MSENRLREAIKALYYAAYWTEDRPVNAVSLWTEVRDAAGFMPGESAKILGPPRESLAEVENAALRAQVDDLKTQSGKAAVALANGWPLPEEVIALRAKVEELKRERDEARRHTSLNVDHLTERAERAEKELANALVGWERAAGVGRQNIAAHFKHAAILEARLAKVVEALEQCVYKRRGDQPGMAQMRDANVMDEDAGAYIRRADAAARSALAAVQAEAPEKRLPRLPGYRCKHDLGDCVVCGPFVAEAPEREPSCHYGWADAECLSPSCHLMREHTCEECGR